MMRVLCPGLTCWGRGERGVTSLAGGCNAFLQVEEQSASQVDGGAKATANFIFSKQWWPIRVAASLDRSRPHGVTVLGRPLVLWHGNGGWHCVLDMCPHRLAPLSEGKVVDTAAGTALQCSYHGELRCAVGSPPSNCCCWPDSAPIVRIQPTLY